MAYQHGKSISRSIRDAQSARAKLIKKLHGVRSETDALRKAEEIIRAAEAQARTIREQAYDFGLAQLDRDYPTRQDRNRERQVAKNRLVKHYARKRLEAATAEADEWERKQAA